MLIKKQKKKLIKEYGPWTAHNIQLIDGFYTIGNKIVGDEIRLRRIIQIINDLIPLPLKSLRILDLACLEGMYGLELARQGAKVVGIEGRLANIEKARFAKDALSLHNFELIQDDVRNLSVERYGYFDVVLCLGILYHLDAPGVFEFVEKISKVCKKIVIIDTHISLRGEVYKIYKGKKYWGKIYVEYSPQSGIEKRLRALWSSLNNPTSFWFTRFSLYNLLASVRFTSVYECHSPPEIGKPTDRITLVGIKGNQVKLLSSPLLNKMPIGLWPERLETWSERLETWYCQTVTFTKLAFYLFREELRRILRLVKSLG